MLPEVTGTVERAEVPPSAPSNPIPRPVIDYSNTSAHAEQFLRFIADPDDWREVRALHVSQRYGKPSTAAAAFQDWSVAAREATAPRECPGVFYTLNAVSPDIEAVLGANRPLHLPAPSTTTDAMIVRRRWLLVDLDPVRLSGVSSTDAELGAARTLAERVFSDLVGQGWAEPVVVCSGNGFHLLFPIDLPPNDGGLVQSVLAALARKYDGPSVKIDTTVFNPARIAALPGTWKRKGHSTADRPHRLVQVIQYPSVRGLVSEEQLRECAGQPGGEGVAPQVGPTPTPTPTASTSTASPPVVDLGGEWRMVNGDFSFSHEGETWTIERFRAESPKGRLKLAECLHGDATCRPALGKSWLHNYGSSVIGRCEGSAHASGAIKYQPRRLRSDVPAELRNVLAHLDVGENGGVKPHLGNMVDILRRDPVWSGRLRFDAFHHEVLLDGRRVEDHNESEVTLYVQRSYAMTVHTKLTSEAMRLVARESGRFDPLADAFARLPKWDGVSRYELVVHDILGIPRDQLVPGGFREVWRRFLIGACARAHEPGCKLDTVLILQSEHQGAGKSTFLRVLAGDFGFSDARIQIGKGGDTVLQLRTAFLHEWGELSAIRSRAAEEVKEFLSQQIDSGRVAYGRNIITAPRRCVIAGTTNASDFLTDSSGSRRFWVLPIPMDHRIDLTALASLRDQLWAEALHEYRNGAKWWMDAQEEQLVAVMNEDFQEDDPLDELAAAWLRMRPVGMPVSLFDLGIALGFPNPKQDMALQRRLGRMLKRLGYVKRKVPGLTGGGRGKRGNRWLPKSSPPAATDAPPTTAAVDTPAVDALDGPARPDDPRALEDEGPPDPGPPLDD